MAIINRICLFIATLGPVGYLPAPGTMGTLCSFPLVIWLPSVYKMCSFVDEGLVVALLLFGIIAIIHYSLPLVSSSDPAEIVLDEIAGFVVTMFWMPLNVSSLLLGFVCFRFFDIIKPFGIDKLEMIPGAWGIVLDDLAAAVFARLAMALIMKLLYL